jgi:hypothetical protein
MNSLGEEQGKKKKKNERKQVPGRQKDHKLLDKKNIDGRVDIMKIKNNRHDEKYARQPERMCVFRILHR